MHQEIDDVLGREKGPITKQRLAQLHYLDLVMKEGLRLFPSAPMISRVLEHDIVLGKILISKVITTMRHNCSRAFGAKYKGLRIFTSKSCLR